MCVVNAQPDGRSFVNCSKGVSQKLEATFCVFELGNLRGRGNPNFAPKT